MKALRIFGNCARLHVINLKSCIYIGGMDDDEKLALLSCTNFAVGC